MTVKNVSFGSHICWYFGDSTERNTKKNFLYKATCKTLFTQWIERETHDRPQTVTCKVSCLLHIPKIYLSPPYNLCLWVCSALPKNGKHFLNMFANVISFTLDMEKHLPFKLPIHLLVLTLANGYFLPFQVLP